MAARGRAWVQHAAVGSHQTKNGVVTFKEKGKLDGRWFWSLPQYAPQEAQEDESARP
jgi:hypothetical protein